MCLHLLAPLLAGGGGHRWQHKPWGAYHLATQQPSGRRLCKHILAALMDAVSPFKEQQRCHSPRAHSPCSPRLYCLSGVASWCAWGEGNCKQHVCQNLNWFNCLQGLNPDGARMVLLPQGCHLRCAAVAPWTALHCAAAHQYRGCWGPQPRLIHPAAACNLSLAFACLCVLLLVAYRACLAECSVCRTFDTCGAACCSSAVCSGCTS